MKTDNWLTILLLVFVVVATATLYYQELNPNSTVPVIQEDISQEDASQEPDAVLPRQIIAYYFYGDQRCATCMKLETYTKEALKTYFKNELDTQLILWKTINVDQPENQHFITDFELSAKMVVLAELQNGTITRWKKLNDIWQLVGDKVAFIQYIQTETSCYLLDES